MIRIECRNRKIISEVLLTPSKSISNRVLMIRALSNENFIIENLSNSSDTKILDDALRPLPVIDVKDAGTPYRFLTAYLSSQKGTFLLKGNERMSHRPIGGLVDALRKLGAKIDYAELQNFPPIKIEGTSLSGENITIESGESSQYVSAILLVAPAISGGLSIKMTGKNSLPYIDMTIGVMKYFGAEINRSENLINVSEGPYQPKSIKIENDWSAASFWYLIAALTDECEIKLCGLKLKSIQGDSIIAEIMKSFGVVSTESGHDVIIRKNNIKVPSFEYDFSACPDLVIPVAVACAALKIKSKFSGVGNLRLKESDRIYALKEELLKTGVVISDSENEFEITSFDGRKFNTFFHSHFDHRMIMSLAALSLVNDAVVIDHPNEVNKSYPEFWQQLRGAGFTCDAI